MKIQLPQQSLCLGETEAVGEEELSVMNHQVDLISPKEQASEWLLGSAELDVGSWSGLDESGPDKLGVGLFFRLNPDDGTLRVVSIVPGSSAHKSGLIQLDDKLLNIDSESVFGWNLKTLRSRLHGPPGSHVTLDLERGDGVRRKTFRINAMRGSPQYVAYQDLYGPANASQLDNLVLQKREEQKFNSMVEKQLKVEQAKFAQVQEQRRIAEDNEAELKKEVEKLAKELFEEEQKRDFCLEEIKALKTKSKKGGGLFG